MKVIRFIVVVDDDDDYIDLKLKIFWCSIVTIIIVPAPLGIEL